MLNKAQQLVKKHKTIEEAEKEYRKWLKTVVNLSGGEKAYNKIDDNGDIYRPVSMAWPNKKKAPDDYFLPLTHPVTNKPCSIPARGWRNPPETMKDLLDNGSILFGKDEKTIPNRKYLLKNNLTENIASLYYMAGSDDDLFKNLNFEFDNPKPVKTAEYCIQAMARQEKPLILDYFAGSGTTAHAVINLNREDNGKRKYILVEQGEYFDTVLKPRVQKVIYSDNWKDGEPQADKDGDFNGVSQMVKVLKLESYEDTLNNLALPQKSLLDTLPQSAQSDYRLHYMLDTESKGSLLSTQHFTRPFDYRLDIATDSAGASETTTIDLVETFNYLLGLTVLRMQDYRHSEGFVFIEGILPQHRDKAKPPTTLIIWRDCATWGEEKLGKLLDKKGINPNGASCKNTYHSVYLNGDNTVITTWQDKKDRTKSLNIRVIEEEFLRLMFAGES